MPTGTTLFMGDARTRNTRVVRYHNKTLFIITFACNYIIHNNEFNFQQCHAHARIHSKLVIHFYFCIVLKLMTISTDLTEGRA